jgi:hypothetical protein
MINLKIKYYILVPVLFFSWVHFASASVEIKQVNLEPIGERFIKLYNNSSSPQNLTDWSIKRKTESGTIYSLVSSSRLENKIIPANGYFLLTNENTYTGALSPDATWAKSYTFSENNTILLYNQNDEIVDSLIVSKTSNNDIVVDENNKNDEEIITDNSSDALENTEPLIFRITTKIISPKTVTAGIPFPLSSITNSNQGQTYAVGKFVWNFGDGMTREVGKSDSFDYTYEYPGEYVVTLSYFDSVFSKTADATNKITIKVIPSEISISSVGDSANPFVEIENKSNSEIILSDWVITGGIHYFKIPDGTVLLPNKKIKLSPKITGFTGEDIQSVSIINPNKDIVATYPAIKTDIKKLAQKSNSTYAIAQNKLTSPDTNMQKDSPLSPNDSQIINLNDLGASAGDTETNISDSTYAFVGLFVVIGVGIASFLIFKKRNTPRDYIEGEIRAEDMTIVE